MPAPLIKQRDYWLKVRDSAGPNSSLYRFACEQLSKINLADMRGSERDARKLKAVERIEAASHQPDMLIWRDMPEQQPLFAGAAE